MAISHNPDHNPALHEEPRNQPMQTVPPILRESLLSWLENTGRFQSDEIIEFQEYKIPEDLDDILEPKVYVLEETEEEQMS